MSNNLSTPKKIAWKGTSCPTIGANHIMLQDNRYQVILDKRYADTGIRGNKLEEPTLLETKQETKQLRMRCRLRQSDITPS